MKLHCCLAGVAAVLLASTQTYAIPITGNIGITGGATYNTSSAASATAVTDWINPVVNLSSGVFASPSVFALTAGEAVSMAAPWNFNTTSPINSFWSVGGFTFQLLSSFILQQGGTPGQTGYVVVEGTGLVSGNGYDATQMSWMFTSQDPKGRNSPDAWTFSASGASSTSTTPPPGVPDGGSTAILLGVALSGVGLLKKKKEKAA